MTNMDIIGSIISFLGVDGNLNRHEMNYFHKVCERLGVTDEEKNAALTKLKQGKGSIYLPQDEADKKRLLYFLAQSAVADGKIADKERKILETVAQRLELPWDYVENFLNSRLQEVKSEQYTPANRPTIECPKCGHQQPASHQCKRCGIIFEKFKQSQEPSDVDNLRELFRASSETNE